MQAVGILVSFAGSVVAPGEMEAAGAAAYMGSKVAGHSLKSVAEASSIRAKGNASSFVKHPSDKHK